MRKQLSAPVRKTALRGKRTRGTPWEGTGGAHARRVVRPSVSSGLRSNVRNEKPAGRGERKHLWAVAAVSVVAQHVAPRRVLGSA